MFEKKDKKKCSENRLISAIYAHVPFCESKCRYCGFYSRSDSSNLQENYFQALEAELDKKACFLQNPADTIYVGGGTPSSVAPALLESFLNKLGKFANPQTEFTVEANPNSVTRRFAELAKNAGANRISLGAQSLNQSELDFLGRIHSPGEVATAFETLRSADFQNISVDLIYGLPGQKMSDWMKNLSQAVELCPNHISCYALSIDPGTTLKVSFDAGEFDEIDDETHREMYYATIDFLADAGFEHYEISNFAKPGFASRHNQKYWHNCEYIGLGAGAVEYRQNDRRSNIASISDYISQIKSTGDACCDIERISKKLQQAETIMLTLRLTAGLDIKTFTRRFGIAPADAFPLSFEKHLKTGSLVKADGRIFIPKQNLFVADSILADIISEAI